MCILLNVQAFIVVAKALDLCNKVPCPFHCPTPPTSLSLPHPSHCPCPAHLTVLPRPPHCPTSLPCRPPHCPCPAPHCPTHLTVPNACITAADPEAHGRRSAQLVQSQHTKVKFRTSVVSHLQSTYDTKGLKQLVFAHFAHWLACVIHAYSRCISVKPECVLATTCMWNAKASKMSVYIVLRPTQFIMDNGHVRECCTRANGYTIRTNFVSCYVGGLKRPHVVHTQATTAPVSRGGTTTSRLHTIITEGDCLAGMPADVVYTICNLCTRDLPRAASVSGEMVSTKVSHCEERIHNSSTVCNPFGSCRYVA